MGLQIPEIRVVDTSVIAKWSLIEADSDKARWLLAEHRAGRLLLSAPSLAVIELPNALFYSGQVAKDQIATITEQVAVDLVIEPVTPAHIAKAVDWMYRFNVAIYDLIFVALAQELRVMLITADERFYNKLQDGQSPDLSASVRLLRKL